MDTGRWFIINEGLFPYVEELSWQPSSAQDMYSSFWNYEGGVSGRAEPRLVPSDGDVVSVTPGQISSRNSMIPFTQLFVTRTRRIKKKETGNGCGINPLKLLVGCGSW